MTRRIAVLGVLVILSQFSTGCCCWRPFLCHRPLCHPCAPMCGPACPVSACSSPVVGHPVLRPGCDSCMTGGLGVHPGMPGPGPGAGMPVISNPIPFGQGPMIYQGEPLGNPTPVTPPKNN